MAGIRETIMDMGRGGEAVTAAAMKSIIFWDVRRAIMVQVCRRPDGSGSKSKLGKNAWRHVPRDCTRDGCGCSASRKARNFSSSYAATSRNAVCRILLHAGSLYIIRSHLHKFYSRVKEVGSVAKT
jgi:hypothetical protein